MLGVFEGAVLGLRGRGLEDGEAAVLENVFGEAWECVVESLP
jgi:hypothetical protein